MDCTYLSHLTDDQLIDLINLYCKQVQLTMEQLMKENELLECVSESTYRMKRNKYITDVFVKASEMCNSLHTHNTVVWKMRVWKIKISDEDMVCQICEFCKDMKIILRSFNTKNDIKRFYLNAKGLHELVYKDKNIFLKADLNRPSPCRKRKLEEY